MNIEALRKFLIAANRSGYAAADSRKWIKEDDCSTSISFTEGELSFHDNFFGGEPFGGRIIVSESGRPKWIMVYYGCTKGGADSSRVYSFLREALKAMPDNLPLRGPAQFRSGNFVYASRCSGDLSRFNGAEEISESGQLIYEGTFSGGWVDAANN